MTTTQLPASDVDSYDYLIAGGGTAGCVIAARLAEYLPHKRILLIEAGPSDFMDDRVLDLKQWLSLLGGELDYDYGTTEQPMGKHSVVVYQMIEYCIHSSKTIADTFDRKLTYQTFSCKGARRMLFTQHVDLVPTLRV
jgi:choline dehydrogenase-like flavoprotein